MATFRLIKGRCHVQIRKKNQTICKSFSDKETAEIWATYKESLIDNIEAFDVPMKDLITLKDAVELKREEMIAKNSKDMRDIENIQRDFPQFIGKYLSDISYDDLFSYCQNLLNSKVSVGGDRKHGKGGGSIRISSPSTVLRKFVVLASVYSYVIKKGFEIENHAQKVVSFLRDMIKAA